MSSPGRAKAVDVGGIFGALDAGHAEMVTRQEAAAASRSAAKPRPRGRPKLEAKEPIFVRLPPSLIRALDQEVHRRKAANGRGSVTLSSLVEELLRAGLGGK